MQDNLSNQDTADQDDSPGCLRGCLYVVAGLSLLLGAFIAAIPMVVGIIARKGLSPADVIQLDEFSSTPQHFPSHWQSIDPYSSALIADRDAAEREWIKFVSSGNYTDDTIRKTITSGGVLTSDEITSITEEVTSGTVAFAAFQRLVQRSDYDVNVFHSPLRTDVPWTLVINGPRLAARKAYLQALDQDWKGAFESTLLSYQVAQRHEASRFFVHLVSNSPITTIAEFTSKLTEETSDTGAMRYALSEMNRLEPRIFPDTLELGTLLDAIGALRDYQREGYSVNLESGHPNSFYHDQVMLANRQFATQMLKRIMPTDPRIPDFQRLAQIEQASTLGLTNGLLANFTLGLGREIMYKDLIVPSAQGVALQASNKTRFDLTRLRLAQRITLLETGELLTSASQFVPALLPAHGTFDESHFQWSAPSKEFVSIDHSRLLPGKARATRPY